MHLPIVFLAKNRYGSKEISHQEFKMRMLQAREIAAESYRILSLQPADSDEGKAAKCLQDSLSLTQDMFKFN